MDNSSDKKKKEVAQENININTLESIKGKRWYCIYYLQNMSLSYKYLHCKTKKLKNLLETL